MKKKKIVTLLICIVLVFPVFAGNQKLYDAFSQEYRTVEKLCRIAGVIGPSSATPITADELKTAVQRIDSNKLDDKHKALLDNINAALQPEDEFSYDIDFAFAPQIFYSKDYEKLEHKDFFIPYNDQDPLLNLGIELEFGDSAFFETSYMFKNNSALGVSESEDSYSVSKGIPLSSFGFIIDYRSGSFNSAFNNQTIKNYGEFPTVSRGAVGGKWMNVVVGRTRQQMGSSKTANLVVGDNYLFQEAMDFTFFAKPFTYSLNITHFDAQAINGVVEHTRYSGPKQQIRIIHRFDAAISDSFRVVLDLGNINYTDNPFDIRYLIPVFMSHNLYNYEETIETKEHDYDEANNIMCVEFEYALMPRLELYMQVVVDQFQTIYETNSTVPNSIGGMIGGSYLMSFETFDAELWAEAVYTSPVLYLNNKTTEGIRNNNYDWALGYWRHETQGDLEWSGYKGGPGVFAITIGSDLDFSDRPVTIKNDLTLKVSNDRSYIDQNVTPISRKYFYLQADTMVNWIISQHTSLYGGLSAQCRWDLMNSEPFRFLPQCACGFKWTF